MALEFNPDGSIKIPKKGSRKKVVVSEKIKQPNKIEVINERESNTYPVVEITCANKKCKSKKAYFWTQQTRASDESETKFYKCTKCEHTWRVYR